MSRHPSTPVFDESHDQTCDTHGTDLMYQFKEYDHASPELIASHFYLSLISAFVHADASNQRKLAKGFPHYHACYLDWNQDREKFYCRLERRLR